MRRATPDSSFADVPAIQRNRAAAVMEATASTATTIIVPMVAYRYPAA